MLFALFHYVALLGLGGLIFFASRVPPKAVRLEPVIETLVSLENVLVAPRKFLLWLWPSESTPAGLGLATTAINSVSWGLALAAVRRFWRQATR